MKAAQCRNLHLAGIDVVLPAIVRIGGRAAERANVVVCFAPFYTEATIAPLAAEWLSQHLHRRFVAGGRGADGNLAAEAFYDKLAPAFGHDRAFVAMLVSPRRMLPRSLQIGGDIGQPAGPGKRQRESPGHWPDFIDGTGFARWNFRGRVRAYVNPSGAAQAGSAQLTFDGLPGGIELIGTGADTASRRCERAHEVAAWYGLGALDCSPADAIAALRREFAEARDRGVEARLAAHV
jgi:hypothetical protein